MIFLVSHFFRGLTLEPFLLSPNEIFGNRISRVPKRAGWTRRTQKFCTRPSLPYQSWSKGCFQNVFGWSTCLCLCEQTKNKPRRQKYFWPTPEKKSSWKTYQNRSVIRKNFQKSIGMYKEVFTNIHRGRGLRCGVVPVELPSSVNLVCLHWFWARISRK